MLTKKKQIFSENWKVFLWCFYCFRSVRSDGIVREKDFFFFFKKRFRRVRNQVPNHDNPYVSEMKFS